MADETPEQPDAFFFSKKNLSNAKKLESGTPLEREKKIGVGEAYEPGLADKQDFAHQDKSEGQPAQ